MWVITLKDGHLQVIYPVYRNAINNLISDIASPVRQTDDLLRNKIGTILFIRFRYSTIFYSLFCSISCTFSSSLSSSLSSLVLSSTYFFCFILPSFICEYFFPTVSFSLRLLRFYFVRFVSFVSVFFFCPFVLLFPSFSSF